MVTFLLLARIPPVPSETYKFTTVASNIVGFVDAFVVLDGG